MRREQTAAFRTLEEEVRDAEASAGLEENTPVRALGLLVWARCARLVEHYARRGEGTWWSGPRRSGGRNEAWERKGKSRIEQVVGSAAAQVLRESVGKAVEGIHQDAERVFEEFETRTLLEAVGPTAQQLLEAAREAEADGRTDGERTREDPRHGVKLMRQAARWEQGYLSRKGVHECSWTLRDKVVARMMEGKEDRLQRERCYVYDPRCGTGVLLEAAKIGALRRCRPGAPGRTLHTQGQEGRSAYHALAQARSMLRGQGIRCWGDTMHRDRFAGHSYDFVVCDLRGGPEVGTLKTLALEKLHQPRVRANWERRGRAVLVEDEDPAQADLPGRIVLEGAQETQEGWIATYGVGH